MMNEVKKMGKHISINKESPCRIKTLSAGVLLLGLMLLVVGCDGDAARQQGTKVALAGQAVSSSAVSFLTNMSDLESIEYNNSVLNDVLTEQDKELKATPTKLPSETHNEELLARINKRMAFYKRLGKVYAALQRLSDPAIADQTKTDAQDLLNSINALNSVPDIPQGITSVLSDLAKSIASAEQERNIKKFNKQLLELCKKCKELWVADYQSWNDDIIKTQTIYIHSLKAVSMESFDAAQLRALVKEPYKTQYLAVLYKINERDKFNNQINIIKKGIVDVESAFSDLENLHEALSRE
jgi:hypothetical protein